MDQKDIFVEDTPAPDDNTNLNILAGQINDMEGSTESFHM